MSVHESTPGGRDASRPRGLADRLDDQLAAFDRWRARPGVAVVAAAGCLVVAILVWWLGRAPTTRRAEDLIPLVSVVTPAETIGGAAASLGSEPGGTPNEAPGAGPADEAGDDSVAADLVVHVTGAVETPGVYHLAAGLRVSDAVEAAGGATDGAALDRLNLAAPLLDGSQIRVPLRGEDDADLAGPTPTVGPGAAGSATGGGAGSAEPGPVELNTADEAALDALPGVGPATAKAIIKWREANGGFRVVEDLLAVPGIGPAKFETLAPLVRVG